ncbi:MAG: hypothetical protein GF365_03800 [Candidatus Buchananbacteria bacterium]|nr:hypothetical protein [Candidatus Buchananbacteria bacterium]
MENLSKKELKSKLQFTTKVIFLFLFLTIFSIIATILLPMSGKDVPFWHLLPFELRCGIMFVLLIGCFSALTVGYELKDKLRKIKNVKEPHDEK